MDLSALPSLARGLVKRLAGYAEILTLTAGGFLLLSFLENLWFVADGAAQIRPQLVVALLGSGAVLALNGKRNWTIAAVAGAVLGLVLSLPPFSLTAPIVSKPVKPGLKIWSQNVLSKNESYDRVLANIKAADPDVILLMEVTDTWRKHLAELEKTYPFHVFEAREDNFGIAFFSRIPVVESAVTDLSGFDVPSIRAVLNWQGREVVFLGVHTVPALGDAQFRARNFLLKDLAQEAGLSSRPVIVAGDLNITPSSGAWRRLLRDGKLRSAGGPVSPSWSPYRVPFLDARIDYVLVSPDWTVNRFCLGPYQGSDHRVLRAELTLSGGKAGSGTQGASPTPPPR